MMQIADDMAIYLPKYKVGTTLYSIVDDKIKAGTILAYEVSIDLNNKLNARYKVHFEGHPCWMLMLNEETVGNKYFFSKEECAKAFVLKEFPYIFEEGKVLK